MHGQRHYHLSFDQSALHAYGQSDLIMSKSIIQVEGESSHRMGKVIQVGGKSLSK